HLVVVLEVVDEIPGSQVEPRRAPPLLLPGVALPLVEIAVPGRRDQLLRRAAVVAVVGLPAAGESHDRRMVPVIVPEGVQPVSPLVDRTDETRLLGLVLGHQPGRARAAGRTD